MRLKQAATYVGLHPNKLRDMVHKGRLRRIQYDPNAPWQFSVRELDAFIERHTITEQHPVPA